MKRKLCQMKTFVPWLLITTGTIAISIGFIPHPKVIQYNKRMNLSSLQPAHLESFPIRAGSRWNFTYFLKNATVLDGKFSVKTSHIEAQPFVDFYITDSMGKIALNAGRVEHSYHLDFFSLKEDHYTFYFDNTYDQNYDKLIDYHLLEAYYLIPTMETIYLELNLWFIVFGEVLFFVGVHFAFGKSFPYVVGFCCGLLAMVCSFFLFFRPYLTMVSILTLLVAAIYVSHRLKKPEQAFLIFLASAIIASIVLIYVFLVFPYLTDFLFAESPLRPLLPEFNKTVLTIVTIIGYAFLLIIINAAATFLSVFIPERRNE